MKPSNNIHELDWEQARDPIPKRPCRVCDEWAVLYHGLCGPCHWEPSKWEIAKCPPSM